MKRRKNRLVVELTTSAALTQRDARKALDLLLDRIDLQAAPIWAYPTSPYADKITVKEFDRVVRAEKRRRKKTKSRVA